MTPPDALLPAVWEVLGRRRETDDTVNLEIAPVGGDPPPFAPGQFHMLSIFGAGEAAISLSGGRGDLGPKTHGERRVHRHTIRDVGAVTHALCALEPGDQLGVRGPFGTPWPIAQAHGHDVVMVAGGIGLAPIMPVVDHVLAHRQDYGHVALLVGTRDPGSRLFVHDLTALDQRPDFDVRQTVDVTAPGWSHDVGLVTRLLAGLAVDPARTQAFVCGPEVMMRFCAQDLARLGVDPKHIFLSLERSMRCGVGHCGHCQYGPVLVCRDGPVIAYQEAARLLAVPGL